MKNEPELLGLLVSDWEQAKADEKRMIEERRALEEKILDVLEEDYEYSRLTTSSFSVEVDDQTLKLQPQVDRKIKDLASFKKMAGAMYDSVTRVKVEFNQSGFNSLKKNYTNTGDAKAVAKLEKLFVDGIDERIGKPTFSLKD